MLPRIEGYALDCRLLFMGDHLRQLVRAHKEIVYRFRQFPDPERLFHNLQSSAEIQQFYELSKANGVVALTLRPSVFEQEGPVESLNMELQISCNGSRLNCPFELNHARALGCLLPLLRNGCAADMLWMNLEARLSRGEMEWARSFTKRLEEQDFFKPSIRKENHFKKSKPYPRVTFLGHSSLLFQSIHGAVLTDPCLRPEFGLPESAMDVTTLEPLALLLSHSHWDHCNFDSLIWFNKDIPVIIPRVKNPSAFNPPIASALKMIGFTDIHEMGPWESVSIQDIEIFTAPFHGEQDEPGANIDHFTYVLKSDGLCVYGGADSYQDTFGRMLPVLERIRDQHHPDIAFLPVSKMVYSYEHGGVNGFCRYIDNKLLNQSFQYTASADDAAEWVDILRPKMVSPYATFNFSRWSTPREVSQFAQALRKRGLGSLLFPLRPLVCVSTKDLMTAGTFHEIRRRGWIFWFQMGAAAKSFDRKLHRMRIYRYLRYRCIGLLKGRKK